MNLSISHISFVFFFLYFASFSQDTIKNSVILDQIVLTGQYVPTHVDSSIYLVDVITADELYDFSSQNLSSVLSRQIGFDVFHDPFLGDYIDYQGISGENIKVLIDGVEILGNQNGTIDFSQINLANIEKIEIVDGPLSTLYGNNALGSTINLISKTKQNEKINISIDSYFESIGQYNLTANMAYKIKKNLFSFSFGRHYFDGWSLDDDFISLPSTYYADSTRFHSWKPKEQWFSKLSYAYKTKNNLLIKPYFDFLNEKVENKGLPQGAFLNYAFDQYYHTRRIDKGILIKGPFLNRNINILFHHNKYSRIKNQYHIDLTNLSELLTDDLDTTYIDVLTNRVTCSNIGENKLNYEYGYALNYEQLYTERILLGKQKRINFSGFSSLDYSFNNFSIRTSFRYSYVDENENKFTPAINFKINQSNTCLRFSYAFGFRTPSLKEMYFNFVDVNHNIQGNPNLNSEYSKNFQINWNSTHDKKYSWNWKVFYNKIDDFITLIQNQNTTSFDYVNIGNYRSLGSKFGLKFNFLNLDINMKFAYLGQSSVYDSNLDFYHMFNTAIKHYINSNNSISLFYSFKSKRPIVSKNNYGEIINQDLSSYNMLDVAYSINLFDDVIDLSFGCNNIFNIQNIDTQTLIASFHNSESSGVPLSCGRYIYTALKINFKYD